MTATGIVLTPVTLHADVEETTEAQETRNDDRQLSCAFSNPSGTACIGYGVAHTLQGGPVPRVEWAGVVPPGPIPGPCFGGWAFDVPWAGFPKETWIIPRVLHWRDGGSWWKATFHSDADVRHAPPPKTPKAASHPQVAGVALGDRRAYENLVKAALRAIAAGEFSKVVVAREVEVTATAPFSAANVVDALRVAHPQCFTYLVSESGGARAFVGASPELLCRIAGRTVETEAVAGTAPRGKGEAMLASAKVMREHRAVLDAIVGILEPLSNSVEFSPVPEVKVLRDVEHLRTPIRAVVRDGVEGIDVARALHPTPAVGGFPRSAALRWLQCHESLDRGWYAGAVGMRGEATLELAVGLRSALLDGNVAKVFVGAGIVAGSDPAEEWVETCLKTRPMLRALGEFRE